MTARRWVMNGEEMGIDNGEEMKTSDDEGRGIGDEDEEVVEA